MAYLLFDIGGTNTRVALSEDLQTFEKVVKYKTPVGFKEGVSLLEEHGKALLGDRACDGVAGGIRGSLSEDKQSLVRDGKLPKWVDQPLVQQLQKKFKAPVYLENDSALVALGEAHFGAGQETDIVAYLTVSTGVGGARIVDGKIDRSSYGFEPGHQIVDIDQTILGDGVFPTLENLVSGEALEDRVGVKPYEIPQEDVIWDELAHYLAQGLRNTIMYWSPDVVVLGGSMIVGNPRIRLEDIRRHTEIALDGFTCPDILDAKLKDEGGLYGAMVLLKG